MKVGSYTPFGQFSACELCKQDMIFPIETIYYLVIGYILKRSNYPCDSCPLYKHNH